VVNVVFFTPSGKSSDSSQNTTAASGVHQEEENEVDLNLTWAEGIRGLMGEKGLIEEDWNDRSKWRKNIL
jgi:hypothetical protein